MGKRVANKKGGASRNRSIPINNSKLRTAIRKGLLNKAAEKRAQEAAAQADQEVMTKPTFIQHMRNAFTGKVFNRGRRG